MQIVRTICIYFFVMKEDLLKNIVKLSKNDKIYLFFKKYCRNFAASFVRKCILDCDKTIESLTLKNVLL